MAVPKPKFSGPKPSFEKEGRPLPARYTYQNTNAGIAVGDKVLVRSKDEGIYYPAYIQNAQGGDSNNLGVRVTYANGVTHQENGKPLTPTPRLSNLFPFENDRFEVENLKKKLTQQISDLQDLEDLEELGRKLNSLSIKKKK